MSESTQMPTEREAALIGASSAEGEVRDRATADFHPEASFFEDLPEAFGEKSLRISVAGISASIEGLSARQHADLAARYGIFARDESGPGEPDLRVLVRRAGRESFLRVQPGSEPEMYRLRMRHENSGSNDLLAWSYEWASRTDFRSRTAKLAATDGDRVIFDRTVENYLRVAFAHMALEKGGLLLHGAAVVREGKAYLFFGPSGSGKTTVTLLSRGDRVLSDDLVILVPGESGFAAASVPFRGLLTPPATTRDLFPIAGLFRLVQDTTDRLEEIRTARGVGEIVQSLPFVTDRPETAPRILEIAGDVAQAVSVRRLHFTKSSRFWKVIEDV